jgi:hypothetical protein
MVASSAHYAKDFPGLDFVLFEPDRSDVEMFFTNIFSYGSRRRLCEHAYQKTRADLLARSETLGPVLAKHGIGLRLDVLHDQHRTLVPVKPLHRRSAPPVVHELESALDALAEWIQARQVRAS